MDEQGHVHMIRVGKGTIETRNLLGGLSHYQSTKLKVRRWAGISTENKINLEMELV